jgi:hypothetical protein
MNRLCGLRVSVVADFRRIGRNSGLLAKKGPSLQLSRRESVDITQSNHQG